ncbi:MAG TPA: dihydrofolate reductase [Patescibacteria group bacterium]|jgi:dihydrofolate reductase|nr:dihydrofolate reductase [Patescibacteria group bacterium]
MKTIVVAVDTQNAIGVNGQLPWGDRGLRDDMKHFRQTTLGGSVIMGRKTFESFGSKPLPDRENIVVSRNPTGVKGVLSALSLQAAYDLARYPIFVIGGGQIYEQALDDMDRLIVTYVDATFEDATVFFPRVDCMQWNEIDRQHFDADERNAYAFDIVTFERAAQ